MRQKYRLKNESLGRPAGTAVYRYAYHDYGLAGDDTRMTGIEHCSVTEVEDQFAGCGCFTCPVHDLEEVPSEN